MVAQRDRILVLSPVDNSNSLSDSTLRSVAASDANRHHVDSMAPILHDAAMDMEILYNALLQILILHRAARLWFPNYL